MMVGYARVSTQDQDTDMQMKALLSAGCESIFHEKGSSVGKRPEQQKALASLRPGDLLVVWKLDRLARSLRDLLSILDRLAAAGAGFKSLTEPIDTSTPAGRLMLQMLGAVGEFERSLIRERSISGQLAALRRGVVLGRRKHCTPPHVVEEMKALYASGQVTYADVALRFGVHVSTAKRLITGYSSRKKMPVLGAFLSHAEGASFGGPRAQP